MPAGWISNLDLEIEQEIGSKYTKGPGGDILSRINDTAASVTS
jgi:hypothetical protein